jgi:hypothetical protein
MTKTIESCIQEFAAYEKHYANKYAAYDSATGTKIVNLESYFRNAVDRHIKECVQKHLDEYHGFFHKQKERNQRVRWSLSVGWCVMYGYFDMDTVKAYMVAALKKRFVNPRMATQDDIEAFLQAFKK